VVLTGQLLTQMTIKSGTYRRKGQDVVIDKGTYTKMVLEFADQVENFYKASLPKAIPTDDFDRKGYLTFWKEWRRLRTKFE
jgi:hypothetical protein